MLGLVSVRYLKYGFLSIKSSPSIFEGDICLRAGKRTIEELRDHPVYLSFFLFRKDSSILELKFYVLQNQVDNIRRIQRCKK